MSSYCYYYYLLYLTFSSQTHPLPMNEIKAKLYS